MAYLHSDREQFRDAIDLAYEQTGVMVQAIEKDYYVTMLLRLLAQKMPYIVFKGGTSLSKCHKVIRRFSEDSVQIRRRTSPDATARVPLCKHHTERIGDLDL